MRERLKKLRKALDLTQQEFADRIGISRGNIATYETREGSPGNSVINLICREFNVSETWLRNGEGEMFVPAPETSLDKLAQEFHLDSLDREIISEFVKLDEKAREAVKLYIKNVSRRLYLEDDAPDAGKDIDVPATAPDIAAELAELKRQNQELAAKVAAMEEEELAADFREAFSALQSGLAGSSDPAKRPKK